MFALVPGARCLFLVIRTEPGGVILGDDDRHLDVADGFLRVSTFVRFSGRQGKLYHRPIQAVHVLVFGVMLNEARRLLLEAVSHERRAA